MKVLIAVSLLTYFVYGAPTTNPVADKFKEYEVIPDILNVAPLKLLEVGRR